MRRRWRMEREPEIEEVRQKINEVYDQMAIERTVTEQERQEVEIPVTQIIFESK
jgi:hypothetical protein